MEAEDAPLSANEVESGGEGNEPAEGAGPSAQDETGANVSIDAAAAADDDSAPAAATAAEATATPEVMLQTEPLGKEEAPLDSVLHAEMEMVDLNEPDVQSNASQRSYELNHVSFPLMVWILTRKNWTLARRNKFGVCMKIFIPVLFMGLMGMLRLIPGMEKDRDTLYSNEPWQGRVIEEGWMLNGWQWLGKAACQPAIALDNFVPGGRYTAPGMVVIIPGKDNEHIRGLMDVWNASWGVPPSLSDLAWDDEPDCVNGSNWDDCPCERVVMTYTFEKAMNEIFRFWDDPKEIGDWIDNKWYGYEGFGMLEGEEDAHKSRRPISTAIIFDEDGGAGPLKWKYTVRMNETNIAATEKPYVNEFERARNELRWQSYDPYVWETNFDVMQTWIDYSLIAYAGLYQGLNVTQGSDIYKFTYGSSRGTTYMPFEDYTTDTYWQNLQGSFMFFVALMCIYPAATTVSILVTERAEKRKEGLMMMNGGDIMAFWLSWMLEFMIEATLIGFLVAFMAFIGDVFRYSDFTLIWIWLWLFFVNIFSFAILLSTVFDNPKIASLGGVILVLVALFSSGFSAGMEESSKNALCLVGPACFSMSLDPVVRYESSQIGIQWSNYQEKYEDFRFGTSMTFMFIDTLIYLALALYLDQVFPTAYGQTKPPHFLCMPQTYEKWILKWRQWRNPEEVGSAVEHQAILMRKLSEMDNLNSDVYEKVDESQMGQCTMKIRDLRKTFFDAFMQPIVKAVRGVNLDIYQDEVFCLLGHNGAGKTTTISMLIGMLTPTEGDALLLDKSIMREMADIRRELGVCLQHDVLWPRLTVREHLEMFGRMKGVPDSVLKDEVDYILKMVNLVDKAGNFATDMSGGQKRRLSLGIAFIGGSKLVFLDEPTSGQDPQSRRGTWELITEQKHGRTIIYTTHELAEADVIGDRIAIMADGVVRCVGTSIFLKNHYGVGYTLVVSLMEDAVKETAVPKIDQVVLNIPNSVRSSVAAREIMYKLPFSHSGMFPQMFDRLDDIKETCRIETYGVSVTTLEEVFLSINSKRSEGKVIKKDEEKAADVKQSAHSADSSMAGLTAASAADADAAMDEFPMPDFKLENQSFLLVFLEHIFAIVYRRILWFRRDFRSIFCYLICPFGYSCLVLGTVSITIAINNPTLELSSQMFDEDIGTTSYTVPVGGFVGVHDSGQTTNQFVLDPDTWFFNQWDNETEGNANDEDDEYNVNMPGRFGKLDWNTYPDDFQMINMSVTLDEERDRKKLYRTGMYFPTDRYSNQLNNGTLENREIWAVCNWSAYHGLPISFSAIDNWIMKTMVDEEATIRTFSHPLPTTERQDALSESFTAFFSALFLMIAFSFIPGGAIYLIVNERSSLQKHQQLVSGITIASYWIGQFFADFLIGLPTCLLVWSAIYIFDVDAFQEGQSAYAFVLVLVMFLCACLPFTYVMSRIFKDAAKAQAFTLLLFIILGLALTLVSFILDLASESTRKLNKDLKYLYRFFPPFLMSDSLIEIALRGFFNPGKGVWDWSVTGQNLFLCFIECVGYTLLVCVMDYAESFPQILELFGLGPVDLPKEEEILDDDVAAEQERIRACVTEEGELMKDKIDDTVILAGLRKVYPATEQAPAKLAVRGLWFGIPQGQCFGFLGVNGAGKTTSLASLTGERIPSSGTAFIHGNPISNQVMCRRFIGYCPQFDALFELLSAHEHLRFYGYVKGLRGEELSVQVKMLIDALGLQKYEHKPAGTYSGGNKRKLSVAIAMIGNPPIVLLDEPSTGVDPESRRHMWKFIGSTMKGRCVILTTHSMEECEALCNRLAIMVDGQLSCLGTLQHLKNKFGQGYQFEINLKSLPNLSSSALSPSDANPNGTAVSDGEKDSTSTLTVPAAGPAATAPRSSVLMGEQTAQQILAVLKREFADAVLIEAHRKKMVFEVIPDDSEKRIGPIFAKVERLKDGLNIESYSISQTSLEQIFVRMAKAKGVKAEV